MPTRALVALLVLAFVTALAPAASAGHGRVHTWRGRVTHIADGDTFDIDLRGDGTTRVYRVRVAGIQTMEIGECHAAPATRSLRRLISGKTVRLRAVDPNSRAVDQKRSGEARLLRFVDIRRNGRWVDVGRLQIKRGHALWHPHEVENLHDPAYHRLSVRASRQGRRLWDTESCRPGPYTGQPLKMWVQSDAEGNDLENVNGEWIRLHNASESTTMNLSGWRLRTAAGNISYTIPRGTSVPPGEALTIHVGQGRDEPLRKFWGRSRPIFPNIVGATSYTGDGAYLFDRHEDLRAWFTYPCVVGCVDPLQGQLAITSVNWDAPGGFPEPANGEWVDLTNISAARVPLYGYLLDSFPYSYPFKSGAALDPGQTMRIYVGSGQESALTKFWGQSEGIFNNGGDVVELRTFDYVTVACESWGKANC
jgi:endonuclease YncB( thermonuclease family)